MEDRKDSEGSRDSKGTRPLTYLEYRAIQLLAAVLTMTRDRTVASILDEPDSPVGEAGRFLLNILGVRTPSGKTWITTKFGTGADASLDNSQAALKREAVKKAATRGHQQVVEFLHYTSGVRLGPDLVNALLREVEARNPSRSGLDQLIGRSVRIDVGPDKVARIDWSSLLDKTNMGTYGRDRLMRILGEMAGGEKGKGGPDSIEVVIDKVEVKDGKMNVTMGAAYPREEKTTWNPSVISRYTLSGDEMREALTYNPPEEWEEAYRKIRDEQRDSFLFTPEQLAKRKLDDYFARRRPDPLRPIILPPSLLWPLEKDKMDVGTWSFTVRALRDGLRLHILQNRGKLGLTLGMSPSPKFTVWIDQEGRKWFVSPKDPDIIDEALTPIHDQHLINLICYLYRHQVAIANALWEMAEAWIKEMHVQFGNSSADDREGRESLRKLNTILSRCSHWHLLRHLHPQFPSILALADKRKLDWPALAKDPAKAWQLKLEK